jgi:recombination protein RecA
MAKELKEKKSIEEILKELDKAYGKGSIISGDDLSEVTEFVSTGSLGLDIAIGIGGIPTDGRIIELQGWNSCGKSTLAQGIVANYQKKYPDKLVIYVDGEFSLDRKYAKKLGIDLKKLMIIQLDENAGEGAYNKVDALVESGEVGLVIYDSYNSLQPLAVINRDLGDATMGVHARLMSTVCAKCAANNTKYGTNYLFLGQLREKIGGYGDPTVSQGGNSLRFYSHLMLMATRSTTKDNSIMEGDNKLGNLHKVKVIKNKVGSPFLDCSFNIIYGEGIDIYDELIEIGHENNIFKKYGKSITILKDDRKLLIEEFVQELKDNNDYFLELRNEIFEAATKNN